MNQNFPDEFYKDLFRLKGVEWPVEGRRKPQYVGHWISENKVGAISEDAEPILKRLQLNTGSIYALYFERDR